MTQITSVYPQIWRALYRVHDEAAWPAPPDDTDGVQVCLGGWHDEDGNPTQTRPLEGLLVVAELWTPTTQEWKTTENGRDETFLAMMNLHSCIPGAKIMDALARFEELTNVVERTVSTARAALGNQPPEVRSRSWWWQIAGMDGGTFATKEGFFSEVQISIKVNARIGGS